MTGSVEDNAIQEEASPRSGARVPCQGTGPDQ